MTLPLKPPIAPQLARPKGELPEGEQWAYEPKYDGFRAIAFVDGEDAMIQSRGGKPLSRYFPELRFPPGRYVLDAGSKAISKDFGTPVIKGRPGEQVSKLAEEHTLVDCAGEAPRVGDRREVIPAHCCATMNLHRQCVAVRGGRVQAVWPVEASGRYD